ncbi:MAG: ribbon-helix-helix domain-containing protein [Acidobacteriota bacterium]
MPFSIRLDQATVNRLTKLAARSHRPVSDVVREAIELYVAGPTPEEDAMTPYDRLAHLTGRIDSGTTRSVGTGRAFAALLEERRRERRAR